MPQDNTHTGSLVIIQEREQLIDPEVYLEISILQGAIMIIILLGRFFYLITHPRKIKKIR